MLKHQLATLLILSCSAVAQNCPDAVFGTAIGNGDDTMFTIRPIGFAFPLNGTTYTDVHICTNGYFHLSNGGTPTPGAADYSSTTTEFTSGSPRIAPMWNDLDVRTDNGGQVFINSTPAKCTITWDRAQNYNTATGGGTLFTMQAQLFPTGEVRFYYSANTSNNSSIAAGAPAITGMTNGGGAVLPTGSDLSVGGATADPTLFESFATANSFDLTNNSLLSIPSAPGWTFLTLGAPTNCAAATAYGAGCVPVYDSFYEIMTPAAFDLTGATISWLRQPTGYIVLNSIPGTIVTPTANATIVANLDDTVQAVTLSAPLPIAGGTTSTLNICSNGHITLSATSNGNTLTPDAATFLAFAQTAVGIIHDLNPAATGSGKILFEQIGSTAYVTWNGVYSYNTTSPNQFQYQFDLVTGNITLVFGAMTPAGNNYLVGYSVGGPSPGVAASDLSVALAGAMTIADVTVNGLALAAPAGPVLGTTFDLVTNNVPALVPLAFLFAGDTQLPGIDLSFVGMPGCNGYTNANLTSATIPVVGTSGTFSLPIPNNPVFAGATVTFQSVAFSLATPLNLITSNGLAATLGY